MGWIRVADLLESCLVVSCFGDAGPGRLGIGQGRSWWDESEDGAIRMADDAANDV